MEQNLLHDKTKDKSKGYVGCSNSSPRTLSIILLQLTDIVSYNSSALLNYHRRTCPTGD
jgi:hypothetical protein